MNVTDAYIILQEAMFKPGDKVRVVRRARDLSHGWKNLWVEEMDQMLGSVYTILPNAEEKWAGADVRAYGLTLKHYYTAYSFPFFALQKEREPLTLGGIPVWLEPYRSQIFLEVGKDNENLRVTHDEVRRLNEAFDEFVELSPERTSEIEEAFLTFQESCEFRPGDRVMLTHSGEDYWKCGWRSVWTPKMNDLLGYGFRVVEVSGLYGVGIQTANGVFFVPPMCIKHLQSRFRLGDTEGLISSDGKTLTVDYNDISYNQMMVIIREMERRQRSS